MNDITSLQLIIGREDENEYIEIDLNEYNEKYKRLQQRINKAIEYIEHNWIEYSDFQYVDNNDELDIDCESIKELLDILKGSDTNESK